MPQVVVVGARYPDFSIEEEVLAPLGAKVSGGSGATPEEIVATCAGADVIVAGSAPRFDATVLEQLSCRALVRAGIGVDSVDLAAAQRLGYWVVHVPDYGAESVALHAVTLALAGLRRLTAADRSVQSGEWGFASLRPLFLPGTAGVVGLGRIGRRVADLFAALGFRRVLAHDAVVEPGPGVEAASLEQVLAESDVVSLHLPSLPEERPLLDGPALALMKQGSVLVNTARGSLVDSPALVAALATGAPGIAALDVFPREPPDPADFAAVADRMILTPHMAWYTEETEQELRRKSAEEAARLLRGDEPRHVVVRPAAFGVERGTQ